jgi:hypothetical protein
VFSVALQIDHVQTDLNIRPQAAGSGELMSGANGVDRQTLERIRPLVLLILREELERLRRQQG